MISIEETVAIPDGWKALVENNLRIPTGYDDALLEHQIKAAIGYVERNTGATIVDKTVTEVWPLRQRSYYLSYKPDEITHVKVNDVAMTVTTEYKMYAGGIPAFIRLVNDICDTDVVEIKYTSTASYSDDHKNAVILIASMYYNNPEGLGALDMRKVQGMMANMMRAFKV